MASREDPSQQGPQPCASAGDAEAAAGTASRAPSGTGSHAVMAWQTSAPAREAEPSAHGGAPVEVIELCSPPASSFPQGPHRVVEQNVSPELGQDSPLVASVPPSSTGPGDALLIHGASPGMHHDGGECVSTPCLMDADDGLPPAVRSTVIDSIESVGGIARDSIQSEEDQDQGKWRPGLGEAKEPRTSWAARSLLSPRDQNSRLSNASSECIVPSPMGSRPDLRYDARGSREKGEDPASPKTRRGKKGAAAAVTTPPGSTQALRACQRTSQDSLYELVGERRNTGCSQTEDGMSASTVMVLPAGPPPAPLPQQTGLVHPLRRVSAAPNEAADIMSRALATPSRASPQHALTALPLLGWLGQWFLRRDVGLLCKLALLLMPPGALTTALAATVVLQNSSDWAAVVVTLACLVSVGGFSAVTAGYVAQHTTRQQATLARELRRRVQVERSVTRFVPAEFLEMLQYKDLTEVSVGHCVTTDLAVLSSDIRDFTGLSQNMDHAEAFDFLNGFTRCMNPVISENRGFVDKYLGDGIVALFRDPGDAVKASITMQQEVENLNSRREGLPFVRMGIGIHWGEVAVGTLGDEERIDAAIISGAVNVASRTEGLTKYYDARVLITEAVASRVDLRDVAHRLLGKVRVKGDRRTHNIYDVYEADLPGRKQKKHKTNQDFQAALSLYANQSWSEAEALFRRCLAESSDEEGEDHAVKTKLYYIERYREQLPFEDWEGEDVWLS